MFVCGVVLGAEEEAVGAAPVLTTGALFVLKSTVVLAAVGVTPERVVGAEEEAVGAAPVLTIGALFFLKSTVVLAAVGATPERVGVDRVGAGALVSLLVSIPALSLSLRPCLRLAIISLSLLCLVSLLCVDRPYLTCLTILYVVNQCLTWEL